MENIYLKDFISGKVSEQEVFDFVLKKMREQGKPSIRLIPEHRSWGCLYRGPNGIKCGIGHLISDDDAEGLDESNDGDTDIKSVLENFPERFGSFEAPPYKAAFLSRLQDAHDTVINDFNKEYILENKEEFIRLFNENMNKVAKSHGLIYTD